jgi:ribosomal protein S18 acetylase RimI-like enzyme
MMQYPAYSDDLDQIGLSQGFSLQRADNATFVRYWAVYRNVNEDFSQSFTDEAADLKGIPYCFWMRLHGRTIGGVMLLPNNIGDLFLIPPNQDALAVLEAIMPLMKRWSNPEKVILAQAIPTRFLDDFRFLGFRLKESRQWMIRPTGSFEALWPEDMRLRSLQNDDAGAVAELLHAAFTGEGGRHGEKDQQAHLASVQTFFQGYDADSALGRASVFLHDAYTGQPTAVTMVNLHKGLPAIQFVAVLPFYRRRGLTTSMVRHALSEVSSEYALLKLAVTVGNPAVKIYSQLGFRAGDQMHSLIIPVSRSG